MTILRSCTSPRRPAPSPRDNLHCSVFLFFHQTFRSCLSHVEVNAVPDSQVVSSTATMAASDPVTFDATSSSASHCDRSKFLTCATPQHLPLHWQSPIFRPDRLQPLPPSCLAKSLSHRDRCLCHLLFEPVDSYLRSGHQYSITGIHAPGQRVAQIRLSERLPKFRAPTCHSGVPRTLDPTETRPSQRPESYTQDQLRSHQHSAADALARATIRRHGSLRSAQPTCLLSFSSRRKCLPFNERGKCSSLS